VIAAGHHGRILASAAMLGSAAAWGSATVLTKDVLEVVPPLTLLVLQLTASVGALAAALLVQGRRPRRDRAARRAGRAGLLEPGLAYAVGVPGVALTTAGSAALLAATEPALVCLVAWAVLGQRPELRVVLSILLAMTGVALVSATGTGGAGAEGGRLVGDLLVLAGTGFAALYVVLSSRDVRHIAPLDLALSQQVHGLGLVAVLALAALGAGLEPVRLPAPGALLMAALSGILQYALPFWLYLTAIRVIPVSQAAVWLTLTPVFGVTGGVIFLGETVAPVQAMGAAMILLALVAMRGRSK
jgi:drug/metabolite transporter (DMT)-like permease